MKRNEKTIIIINTVLVVFAIVFSLTQLISSTLRVILQPLSLIILSIIAFTFIKPQKTNKHYAQIATKSIIIVIFATLIISFNIGVIVGFTRTFFPPSWRTFLLGFLPSLTIIVASEFYRKAVIGGAYENRKLITYCTITLIIVGILSEISFAAINSIEAGFIAASTIILPSIAENLLATYLIRRAGMKPVLLYRLPRSLYLYILPIAPAFSQYLYSVMWVVIPYFIYLLVKKDLSDAVSKHNRQANRAYIRRRNFSILAIPTTAVLITLVVLTSGILRYKMIAIASGSMSPTFDRGDAVIYDKAAELEEGKILAFEYEGRIVTHRIIKVTDTGSEKTYYTKGDANDTSDNYSVTQDSALGEVKYVVKYIGIPTVWFNETIGNIQ